MEASLRVLVACEFSGVVRRAFANRGHDAWSCDLLPADDRSNKHIIGDVRDHLGDGWDLLIVAHPPCFIGTTLIHTAEGFKPISDVRVGDMVLTHKGRWRPVAEVMCRRTGKLVRVKSSNCLETTTTPEHPYFSRFREPYRSGHLTLDERDRLPDFVNAASLTKRHFTGSVLPPAMRANVSDDDLWLMGRYVADGHLRESRWTPGKYEEMVISVGPSKRETFLSRVARKVTMREGGTAIKATFYGHDDIAPFAQFGRGAAAKALPAWVLALPVEQARQFLDGYLSGDGYVRAKCVSATTVSDRLALGIAVLMQRAFGKCPALRTSQPRPHVVIEGREVQTLPLHNVEVPNSNTRLRNYVDRNYAWGHVRNVAQFDGDEMVFNLSVAEDETYTANGVVVHNCTRLCRSGRRWLSGPGNMTPPKQLPQGRTWESMKAEFEDAVDLFVTCWRAPVDRVAIENPRMHDLARERMPADVPPPDIVQPFWFGRPEYKATGWYLQGLPPLLETDRLPEPERGSDEWKAWNRVWRMPPGRGRGRQRSAFFPGMADAMATQWGDFALTKLEAVA